MILSRLKNAIREQNWFAVVLEMLIVIVGVVIGFQISAWGDTRTDRDREQTYLHQLAEDLHETERDLAFSDSLEHLASGAIASVHHAYYQPQPPKADSLAFLILRSFLMGSPTPVMGTAEALVATGDLNLIRDDSLRAAITRYLDLTRDHRGWIRSHTDNFNDEAKGLWRRFDTMALWETLPEAHLDSLVATDLFYLPQGPRVTTAPFDRDAFLADTDARSSVFEMLRAKRNTRNHRRWMREEAVALRERVESQLK